MPVPTNQPLPWSRRLTGLVANGLCFIAGFTLIVGLLPAIAFAGLYGLGLLQPPANWVVGHTQFIGFHLISGLVLYLPYAALLPRLRGGETRKAQSRLAALLAVSPLWMYVGLFVCQGVISVNDHGFGELIGVLAVYSCLLILGGGLAGALACYQRRDPKHFLRVMTSDIRQSAGQGGQFILRKLTDQAWSQIKRQSLGRCAAAFLLMALLFSGLLLMQSLTSRDIAIRAGEMHVGLNRMRQMAEQPSLLKGDPKTFSELTALTDHLDRTWDSFRMLSPGTDNDLSEADQAWQALRAETRSLLARQPALHRLHAEQLSLRSDFEHTRKQLEALQERLLGGMLARKEPVGHIAKMQGLSVILSREAASLDELHAYLYEGLERNLVQEDGVGMDNAVYDYLQILNDLLSDPQSPRSWHTPQEWMLSPEARPVMQALRNGLTVWLQRKDSFRINEDFYEGAFHIRPVIVIRSKELDQQLQRLTAHQAALGGLMFLSLASWLCFGMCLYGMTLAHRPGWEAPGRA